jgi:hypothetical protein
MRAPIQFPYRRLAGFLLGFLGAAAALNLLPHDPLRGLDQQGNGRDLPLPPPLAAPRAPGEFRIAVLGASETVAYPYAPIGAASYGTLLGPGLAAVYPDRSWRAGVIGETAVDSAGLLRCTGLALQGDPDLVCVTLGGNEFNRRLFSTRKLVAETPLEIAADRLSRGRILFDAMRRTAPTRDQPAFEAEVLLRRVPDARPARPAFAALPLPAGDVELIHDGAAAAMRQIAAQVRARGIRLFFLHAPYDLAGTWPAGMVAREPAVDALVRQAQQDLANVGRAEVEALVAAHPGRADVHFLHGLVLRRDGDAAGARAAFVRARDLDPSPQHPTSALAARLRATAAELGVPWLELDDALLGPDRLPDPERFLDSKHPDLEGHRRIAWSIVEALAGGGVVPPLPPDAAARFDAATREWHATQLDQDRVRRARSLVRWTSSLFDLLSGNFRDALDLMLQTFADLRSRPDDPFGVEQLGAMAPYFLFCLHAEAGRLETELRGGVETLQARAAELEQRLRREYASGDLPAWVAEFLKDGVVK